MKTRLTVKAGAWERYVIAQYYAVAGEPRQRATRKQVRRFVQAAFQAMVQEQTSALRGRQRTTALRLALGLEAVESLKRPREQQPSLL